MPVPLTSPEIILQLETQLNATAEWSGTNYYPSVDWSAVSFPAALLAEMSVSDEAISEGGGHTQTGELLVVLYYDTAAVSLAEMETKARNIKNQLLDQDPGIPFTGGTVSLATEPKEAEVAGQAVTYFSVEITLPYGIGG